MKRRTFLTLSGLALAAGFGGCVSDGPADDTGDGDPGTASEPRQFQTDAGNTGHTGGGVPGSATVIANDSSQRVDTPPWRYGS